MTIQISEDKPSPEDVLHYGVKGMKWGHRKPTGDEIRSARARVGLKQNELHEAQKKARRGTDKDRARAAKLTTEFLKNPDRPTAIRMTTGEKFITGIFGSPAAAGLSIAITETAARTIEDRQASGYYDRKR